MRKEKKLKLTRHNGRAGSHGIYNPKHNDRQFQVENSDHIHREKLPQNIYWDCYRGLLPIEGENPIADFNFEKAEHCYYWQQYFDFIEAQNQRNEKARHPERNRTVEDLLQSDKTCPEETIYQLGTVEESVSAEILLQIANEFYQEFDCRFGKHVHILDWALHLDEGTPHIHERHVFDCKNQHGELCPQQEKALECLGIPLPHPEKPKGKHNNRKQTFDAVCREILFSICEKYGLQVEREPSYGGRGYLEKQDYILMKQQEKLEELSFKIENVETMLEDVSEIAYDKAVETVTDMVKQETQKEDLAVLEQYEKSFTGPGSHHSFEIRQLAKYLLGGAKKMLAEAAGLILEKVQKVLHLPDVRKEKVEEIKEGARKSVLAQLKQA